MSTLDKPLDDGFFIRVICVAQLTQRGLKSRVLFRLGLKRTRSPEGDQWQEQPENALPETGGYL